MTGVVLELQLPLAISNPHLLILKHPHPPTHPLNPTNLSLSKPQIGSSRFVGKTQNLPLYLNSRTRTLDVYIFSTHLEKSPRQSPHSCSGEPDI